MKLMFAEQYYCRGSLTCLRGLLTLIVFMALSPSVLALQTGDFEYTESSGAVTITWYAGFGGNVAIPEAINGRPVLNIEAYAFYECSALTGITIPPRVTRIGASAFAGCSGLTSVTIPDSVTSIGDAAFYKCRNLSRAYFCGNEPSMGFLVFYRCARNFTVCYSPESSGFTNPWHGYTAAECEETQ
jgi:hypothetical protein